MAEDRDSAQRSIVSAIGVGAAAASMLIAQNAEAATQVAQIAESDNRLAIILTLFVPALGWVGFNMLQPALNQVRCPWSCDRIFTISPSAFTNIYPYRLTHRNRG